MMLLRPFLPQSRPTRRVNFQLLPRREHFAFIPDAAITSKAIAIDF
jgi:hypothetical protein